MPVQGIDILLANVGLDAGPLGPAFAPSAVPPAEFTRHLDRAQAQQSGSAPASSDSSGRRAPEAKTSDKPADDSAQRNRAATSGADKPKTTQPEPKPAPAAEGAAAGPAAEGAEKPDAEGDDSEETTVACVELTLAAAPTAELALEEPEPVIEGTTDVVSLGEEEGTEPAAPAFGNRDVGADLQRFSLPNAPELAAEIADATAAEAEGAATAFDAIPVAVPAAKEKGEAGGVPAGRRRPTNEARAAEQAAPTQDAALVAKQAHSEPIVEESELAASDGVVAGPRRKEADRKQDAQPAAEPAEVNLQDLFDQPAAEYASVALPATTSTPAAAANDRDIAATSAVDPSVTAPVAETGADSQANPSSAVTPATGAAARMAPGVARGGVSATANSSQDSISAVDRARFVQRVARAFTSAQERGGEVRLRLAPPELGSLRLEVSMQQGQLAARLEAETPAARALLLESLPALRERLAERQIENIQFEVDLMDRHASGGGEQLPQETGRQAARNSDARRSEAAQSDAAAPAAAKSAPGAGKLNVVA